MERGTELTDYSKYVMSSREKFFNIVLAAFAIFAVAFVFYRSIIMSLLLCLLAFLYPKMKTQSIIEKRKNELNLQFKEMLYSLSSSMSVGKSVEMAFRDVLKDLAVMYPDPEACIIQEVEYVIRKIEMNGTVEAALQNFAERSGLEDVENFSDVFETCKRTGGNLVEVIRNTSNIIRDKIEIKEEINTMIAEKKFEQKVLNVVPIFLVIMLSVTAADYMEPVFSTIIGKMVMTLAIALLVCAYFISKHIMNIKI